MSTKSKPDSRGLDPAIHRFEIKNVFAMDTRVKPAYDELRNVGSV
jgi:hypothetical protein